MEADPVARLILRASAGRLNYAAYDYGFKFKQREAYTFRDILKESSSQFRATNVILAALLAAKGADVDIPGAVKDYADSLFLTLKDSGPDVDNLMERYRQFKAANDARGK